MRALVFSDIHDNLANVEALRRQERNEYDFIIVAGDIGSRITNDFIKIVDTFACPAYIVYGNWDYQSSYDPFNSENCKLLNNTIERCGKLFIAGFSGCPVQWGNNPIYLKKTYRINKDYHKMMTGQRRFGIQLENTRKYKKIMNDLSRAKVDVLRTNRRLLFNKIRKNKIPQDRLIIVTHQRLTKLADNGIRPLLHIFGHIHEYKLSFFQGTWYLNAAALDNGLSADFGRINIQPEGYCIVEFNRMSPTVIRKPRLQVPSATVSDVLV